MKKTMLVSILTAVAVSAFATTVDDQIVYRPSSGFWYGAYSLPAPGGGFNDPHAGALGGPVVPDTQLNAFGLPTATPLVGDINGDGIDDMVVAQPNAAGTHFDWHAAHSTDVNSDGNGEMSKTTVTQSSGFGLTASDGQMLGDINGDGIQDIITINSSFQWHAVNSSTAGIGAAYNGTKAFGLAGDNPIVGDFNGDGKDDIGVYRGGASHVQLTGATGVIGSGVYKTAALGAMVWNDFSLVGDINGDGYDDLVIVAADGDAGGPATLLRWLTAFGNADGTLGGTNVSNQISFGLKTDIPMLADINGDGLDDLIAVRTDVGANQKRWYSAYTDAGGVLTGAVDSEANFGLAADVPLFGQLNVIPEPASIAMLMVGGGILWVRKRLMI